MAKVVAKFCVRGDLFLWINGQLIKYPREYEIESAQKMADRQSGTELHADSLVEVTTMLMTDSKLRSHQCYLDWIDRLSETDQRLLAKLGA
jgi:hypothetical protein